MCLRAFVEADTAWYNEDVSEDFICTRADGGRIEKPEFLPVHADAPSVADLTYHRPPVRRGRAS